MLELRFERIMHEIAYQVQHPDQDPLLQPVDLDLDIYRDSIARVRRRVYLRVS
jgi:hypothetical protein